VLFLIYLTVVGLGSSSSRYSKTADLAVLSLHLALVAILSVSLVRAKWREWHHQPSTETLLQRWRRWVTDNPRTSN
jgi:cytochrome b561